MGDDEDVSDASTSPGRAPAPGMAAFDSVYGARVLGRAFVEYADYYRQSRGRYRAAAARIGALGLPPGTRHLDVGGGQMALLCRDLYGFAPTVGDVVDTAVGDVVSQGAAFQRLNLLDDAYSAEKPYDLVTLLEVIEHIPHPPYVTFAKLARILRPGGWLLLTTPNFFRIRNVLRMLAGREVLDIYRYPEGDEALGHQYEFTAAQMDWQLRHAGFTPAFCTPYRSGLRGASAGARLAHVATLPFALVPHLRDGLIAAARAPGPIPDEFHTKGH